MGACSCTPKCACAIHAKTPGNGLVSVTGDGNPATGGWEIEVGETGFAATALNEGIIINPAGSFGHAPAIGLRAQSSPTVTLAVGPNGLEAHVTNAPSGVGGVPTGTLLSFMGDVAPSGFLMASGPYYAGYVSQADYAALYSVMGHKGSGGVDPGNGTFAVPYVGDKMLAGQGTWGGIGATGGVAAVTLGIEHLAPHAHGVSDPQHGHAATSTSTTNVVPGGSHQHPGAGASHDFIVEDTSPESYVYLHVDAVNVDTAGTFRMSSNGLEGGNSRKPNREGNTYPAGSHDHTVTTATSTAVSGAATGVSILNNGGGQAHENRPPFMVTNFIVKT